MSDEFTEAFFDEIRRITHALDQAGINNVLWDDVIKWLLNQGVSSMIDYIVHDGMAEKACQALLAAGLEPCERGEQCWVTRPFLKPVAAAHVHLKSSRLQDTDIYVAFWNKSSLLFAFPDLPSSPPSSDNPYYMPIRIPRTYFDDTSRRPPLDLTPARMVRPVKIVEALIWLTCRDRNPNERLEMGWEDVWQIDLLSWERRAPGLAKEGLFFPNEMRSDFRPLWNYLCGGEGERSPKQHRAYYLALQAKFRAENALPRTPQPKRRTRKRVKQLMDYEDEERLKSFDPDYVNPILLR
ncbi:hypothetical protein ASPBRDRAFT_190517 [Aspergillus brasiliensis CBS 101740]|uniref:Uncharacterized protein n=1 Tax=Aspergillus brasiliensis (strain CBS 101740 / IMI 381727 / IBT 21946) TaxID=767769 RepID=A0A1L9UZP0_ASPBC|nr:hypothetical protein ASPBRDRAFT_190517 [Aspergillus brasiliensis CBS 101740]